MITSLLALDNTNANVGFVDAKDPSLIAKGESRTAAPLSAVNHTWSKLNVPYTAGRTLKATLVYPDPPAEL